MFCVSTNSKNWRNSADGRNVTNRQVACRVADADATSDWRMDGRMPCAHCADVVCHAARNTLRLMRTKTHGRRDPAPRFQVAPQTCQFIVLYGCCLFFYCALWNTETPFWRSHLPDINNPDLGNPKPEKMVARNWFHSSYPEFNGKLLFKCEHKWRRYRQKTPPHIGKNENDYRQERLLRHGMAGLNWRS